MLVVNYRGTQAQLQAALAARGWQSDTITGVFRITGYAPPPQPQVQPAQPQPVPAQPQATPPQPAPGASG